MTDEITFEEMDDLLASNFSLLWTKTQIAECYKRGLNHKQTVQYMYDLAEFTTEILTEINEREGNEKEVIMK